MKNDSVDNLRIDLNRQKIRSCIYVRCGDTKTRTIHFSIANNGVLLELDDLVFAEILILKPDGNTCDNPLVRRGNELQYTLRTGDIDVPGECRCQLALTFSDMAVETTPEFSIVVHNKVMNQEEMKSQNEYGILSQYVLYANECQEKAAQSAEIASQYAQEAKVFYEVIEQAKRIIEQTEKQLERLSNIQAPSKVSELENDKGYVTTDTTYEVTTEKTDGLFSKENLILFTKMKETIEDMETRLNTLEEMQGYPGTAK